MAVARKKGDQAKEQGCEDCDPALPIETAPPVEQPCLSSRTFTVASPKPDFRIVQTN